MDPKKMMGFENPGDKKFSVSARDWSGMKHAAWRSKVGWEIAERQAKEILGRCTHLDGCPGITDEAAPCLGAGNELGCPDRELRMSALVILNAARQFAPVSARQIANEIYFAPSRERYSEVIAELGAVQAELEDLKKETTS